MSNSAKKPAVRGVRYTDAEKKEVIDFVSTFNTTNGRGGQSKAAEKFGISQITIAAWLKGSGAAAPGKKTGSKAAKAKKAEKAPKAPKASKAPKAKKTKAGSRYTPEQKQEVIDFVASYNAANGRGGQSTAAAKFGVSPLTVMAWLKGAGVVKSAKNGKKTKAGKVSSAASASGAGFGAKLNSLVSLNKQIQKAEAAASKAQSALTKAQAEVAQLKSKFSSLKASL